MALGAASWRARAWLGGEQLVLAILLTSSSLTVTRGLTLGCWSLPPTSC
ncbi:aminopeptidase YpdF [Cutibacterium acnes JCM 18920]|nr:aminopeptidase YpdF [Cutibacterium acnes JCM 18920]